MSGKKVEMFAISADNIAEDLEKALDTIAEDMDDLTPEEREILGNQIKNSIVSAMQEMDAVTAIPKAISGLVQSDIPTALKHNTLMAALDSIAEILATSCRIEKQRDGITQAYQVFKDTLKALDEEIDAEIAAGKYDDLRKKAMAEYEAQQNQQAAVKEAAESVKH